MHGKGEVTEFPGWEERIQHRHKGCRTIYMSGWEPSPRHSLRPMLATLPKPLTPDSRVTWGPHTRDKALMNKFSALVPEWKPLQPKNSSFCILLCLLFHFISALLMAVKRAGRTRGQVGIKGTFEGGFRSGGTGDESLARRQETLVHGPALPLSAVSPQAVPSPLQAQVSAQ